MSKIGVGIGEDFPVDDGKPREDRPREARGGFQGEFRPHDDDADYAARREAHRKWHEQRRAWKRQWRDEWRARRGEIRDQIRGSYYGGGAYRPGFGHPMFWGGRLLWPVLAVLLVIAAISFLFSHLTLILGALVVLVLGAAAFHRGFEPWGPRHHYAQPPQAPQPPAPPRDTAH